MKKSSESKKKKQEENEYTFDFQIRQLNLEINSLRKTLPLINSAIITVAKRSKQDLYEIKEKLSNDPRSDESLLEIDEQYRYIATLDDAILILKAKSTLQESYLISLVVKFDTFIGLLLKTIYKARPELLTLSQKSMSLIELVQYSSINEAKDYILDSEIDDVLRESHTNHFKYLEKISNVKLISNLPNWKYFIEVTERRNIVVHSNGLVSRQYIEVCNYNNYPFEKKIKIGESRSVSVEYIHEACDYIFEIGFVSAQILWRKLLPQDLASANSNYESIVYKLLLNKEYGLAKRILDLTIEQFTKKSSEAFKLRMIINKAVVYKMTGEESLCVSILDEVDWSAKEDKYKLALAVLKDDYENAGIIMKTISPSVMGKEEYSRWPVFEKFRKSEVFLDTFKSIFNEDFSPLEENPNRIEEVVKDINTLSEPPLISKNS